MNRDRWLFGTMYGFARGGTIISMLNDETGLGLTHYEYATLHLAFYDLEFFEPADLCEHVGCESPGEADFVIKGLVSKGLVERDKDGDLSLTQNGWDAQEHINSVFESIASLVEKIETGRDRPTSETRKAIN